MDKAPGMDIGELGFDPGTFATALMTLEEFRSKDRVIWAGLDIGVASCGLCLVDVLNHEIVLMASHPFKSPVVDKKKASAAPESLASVRRGARSVRRNIMREGRRKKAIRAVLADAGLIPADAGGKWFSARRDERTVVKVRAKALKYPLNSRELARVLYSFASHRGYIDHGKSDKEDDAGKVKKALAANHAALAVGECETFGQYLSGQPRSRNRAGDYSYTADIGMTVDEVRTIFARQRELGSEIATEALEERYIAELTWLTDTSKRDMSTYLEVGFCTYRGAPYRRGAMSTISFAMVRAHQTLCNAVILHGDGSTSTIPGDVRIEIVRELFAVKKSVKPLKWSGLRRRLGLAEDDLFKGCPVEEEKRDCIALPAWAVLCSGLYDNHRNLLERLHDNIDDADAVCSALTFASSAASLAGRLAPLALTDDEVEAIVDLPYSARLFSGYASASLEALQMLRGTFEDPRIMNLRQAEEASGLAQVRTMLTEERGESSDGLLCAFSEYDPACKNPVVLRATAQVRRMVNSAIRHYGLPDIIRVEVARDLKRSKHEREIVAEGNRARLELNEQAKRDIIEFFGLPDGYHVRGRDLAMVKLYREQGGKDPYTGAGIDFRRMLEEHGYAEIDHILPISRTCDDSQTNKVLCLTKSNRDKSNRSPFEWMASGEDSAPDWGEFCGRMKRWAKNCEPRRYANKKLANLTCENLAERTGDFIDRNLSDTRYMSTALAKWLRERLPFPRDNHEHVFCVAGGATALMRGVWGIGITGPDGRKNRDDDRHHAVDAAVIACCTPGIVKNVALVNEGHARAEERQRLFRDSLPYPEFKEQVDAWIPCIVPTLTLPRTVTGSVLKDTVYPYLGRDEAGKDLYLAVKKDKEGRTVEKKVNKATTMWKDGRGGCRAYGAMCALDAVFDASAGKRGKWTFDPVYCIDIPQRDDGIRSMRVFSKEKAIDMWDTVEVPEDAPRMMIRRGDVLVCDGKAARFYCFDISVNAIKLFFQRGGKALQATGPLSDESFPSPSKWGTDIRVMQEDCLGLCWLSFLAERAAAQMK